ncbi:hypothetical protein BGW37DRAFT_516786 [Umbelopsis sp. PMI_123]|nr:hypothetical protein BGW37DRAFT_516786 [Umbelopsis sp. PMI_123]
MNSNLGKHDRSNDGPYSNDLDFASDHEEFSLPRNVQPTGYVDTDNLDQASMDTHLPTTNMGYKLLLKMGWSAGEGLGVDRQGRVDPIRIDLKMDALGIGKAEEEMEYHASSTAQRRALDSEKQMEETEEDKLNRQMNTLKKEAVKNDIKEKLRAFYCQLCDKQYSQISEYEQHLQSYDHHHKKRFKEMRESSKNSEMAIAERESRRERERKREERENRRIHEAMLKKSGVKLDQIPGKVNPLKPGTSELASKGSIFKQTSGSTEGGWLTTRSSTDQTSTPPSRSGWSTVSSGGTGIATESNNSTSGGWVTPMEVEKSSSSGKSTVGGWTSLASTSEGDSIGPSSQIPNTSSTLTLATDTTTNLMEVDAPKLFSSKKQPQKMSFGMNKKPAVKFGFKK